MADGLIQVGGIKCDNPNCDYKDMSVKYEEYPGYIGRPCPLCGSNLLTQEDYNVTKFYMELGNNPIVKALNELCLKLGSPEKRYVGEFNGTGSIKFTEVKKHIDIRL